MAKKQGNNVDFLGIDGLTSIVRDINNEEPAKQGGEPSTKKEEKKNAKKGNEKEEMWDCFVDNVQYYKENATKGQAIWIDDDIKDTLEMMKGGPLKSSVKTLANAMLRTFIEQNKENCKKYTGTAKKGLL